MAAEAVTGHLEQILVLAGLIGLAIILKGKP
jgi:hypothetical protein